MLRFCSDVAQSVLSQFSVNAQSVFSQLKTLKTLTPDCEGAREGGWGEGRKGPALSALSQVSVSAQLALSQTSVSPLSVLSQRLVG